MMKAVVSFLLAGLLLVGSFIPQNDLAELGKLPQLLEHYRYHHSAAGGGLSLVEFMAEHYGAGTKHHFGCTFSPRHQHDHQGLPLHGRHADGGHGAFLLLAPTPLAGPRRLAAAGRAYCPAAPAPCPEGRAPALRQPPRA